MKTMTHVEFGGRYQYDPETGKLTKVLICHHADGTTTHDIFDYHYCPTKYREVNQ